MEFNTFVKRLAPFSQPKLLEKIESSHVLWLIGIVLAGSVLRFATLGSVSLHGDEETMGFAVRSLIEHGVSAMPSGMEYRRAILQIYLQAASVLTLGESEFSLRLPSAIVGTLLPLLAFALGRRFVSLPFALILALAAALLPIFVTDSQTGRMYVFLIAATGLALWSTFRWCETQRLAWLAGTLVVIALAMQFHALAVLSLGMLLYPGLVNANARLMCWGIFAVVIMAMVHLFIRTWTDAPYPPGLDGLESGSSGEGWNRHSARLLIQQNYTAYVGWVVLVLSAGLVGILTRSTRIDASRIAVIGLIAAGLSLIAIRQGYAGAALLLFGVLLGIRRDESHRRRLLVLFCLGIALLLAQSIHAAVLIEEGLRRAIGTQLGRLSPWPMLQLASLAPGFALFTTFGALGVIYALSRRELINPVWLIFVLLVLIPMTFMGFLAWYVPTRYTEGSLIPFLLAGAWSAERLVSSMAQRLPLIHNRFATKALAASAALILVNPDNFLRPFKDRTAEYPDHRGAAEFIIQNELQTDSIIIAEDVLQQTFYLGHVDYWLISPQVARQFTTRSTDGHIVDIYTATRSLTDAKHLKEVIDEADREGLRVILIGSGEEQEDGRAFARGADLNSALERKVPKSLFVGKDSLTRVWLLAGPALET